MNRFFTIYALTDCIYCKKAIDILHNKKLPFIVVIMDKNPEFVKKVKEDMKRETVPIVIEHLNMGEIRIIGGSDDLEKFLSESENGSN